MGSVEQQTAHLQQPLREEQKTRTKDIMRIILVVSFLVASVWSSPAPTYKKCSTVYTTVWDIEYTEKEEKVCKPKRETTTEPVCEQVPITTTEYYYETVCTMEDQKHCVKIWETDYNGNKIWVENPNECKKYTKDVCKDEKMSKPVVKYEEQCKHLTKTQCKNKCEIIHERIPKEVSKKVPKKVCTH